MDIQARKFLENFIGRISIIPKFKSNKYLTNYLIKKRYLFNNSFDVFAALEKFNYLVNTQAINIDINNILKEILVKDLGYSFCAICSKNEEFGIIEISFINKDKAAIEYVLPLDLFKHRPLGIFNYYTRIVKVEDIPEEYRFNISEDVQEVLCLPIDMQNKCEYILCVGSNCRIKLQNPLLRIIAQQLKLILINFELNKRIKEFSYIDPVTSLVTHSNFQQKLNFEMKRSKTVQKPLSLIMIDLKNKNEGDLNNLDDHCIANVVSILKQNTRKVDVAARLGSSKMAIILPNTDSNNAHILSRKFVKDISKATNLQSDNLIVSIGISTYPSIASNKEELLNNTDEALKTARTKSAKLHRSVVIRDKEIKPQPKKSNLLPPISSDIILKSDLTDELIYHLHQADNMNYNSSILLEIITSLAAAIDAKDTYTRGHSQAVSRYAEMMCQDLGLNMENTRQITMGALMHDIGKIGVPEKVLTKSTPLNNNDWELIKQHPTIGARRIIQPISALNDLIPIVEHHHERWDGSGYPYKLRKEEIPLGARIVSIVDAFHTMTTDRPYRKSIGVNNAIKILEEGAGEQWDTFLVKTFINRIYSSAYNIIQN